MENLANATIGQLLPEDMRSSYDAAVLNTTLKQARDIIKYDMPAGDLSAEDVKALKEIYSKYKTEGGSGDGDAYWDKTESQNTAYWDSTGEESAPAADIADASADEDADAGSSSGRSSFWRKSSDA